MGRKPAEETKLRFDPFRERISETASQLKTDVHVWEAKISLELYMKIRALIEEIPDLDFALSEMPEDTAQIVRYCVGEWWKREYHDKSKMNIRGLNTGIYKKVVDICNIEHDKVNPGKPLSPTEWLDTLCAEGGIPVFDVISKLNNDKSSALTNTLEELYSAESDIDEDITDKLFTNNQTIKRSKSIRDLIPYLQKGNMPYNPGEKISLSSSWTFAELTNALENAQTEHLRNKFSIEYHLWKLEGFPPALKTCIKFRPDETGSRRNYAITASKLEYWGVGNTDEISGLRINFNCADSSVTIPFFKCGNGDWIPFENMNVIETDLPILKDIEFSVIIANNVICTQKIKRGFKSKGYVQMFSQDGANWTSFGGSAGFSLVVFDPEAWSSPEAVPLGDTGFEYIFLTDGRGKLRSNDKNGEEVVFNNAEGSLFVEPANILFTSGEFFGRIGNKFGCKVSENDDEDDIRVFVTDSTNFIAKIGKTDKWGNESWKEVTGKELQVLVRTTIGDKTTWRSISDLEPDQLNGLKHLRVKARGKEARIDCFFLPGGSYITRKTTPNSGNGAIEITGMAGLDVKPRSNISLQLNANRKINCSYQASKESDGCWLDIFDSDKNILHIGVYWPYDWSDIIKETHHGRVIYSQNAVATVFAGTYIHRKFSSEGVSLNRISDDGRLDLNDFIKRALLDNASQGSVDGCNFRLFNKTLLKDDQYPFIIESGKSISTDPEQMKFIFVPSNKGEIIPLELKLDEVDNYNNKKQWLHIVLPESIADTPGVIFQSLEGDVSPDIYFRPEYKIGKGDRPKISPADKKLKQKERVESYFSKKESLESDFETSIRAFGIAGKIQCHYGWFDEIKALCAFNDGLEERLVSFFERYIKQCETENVPIDYAALWRLVGEFLFDWIFIPAAHWKAFAERNPISGSRYMEDLFRARPGARGAVRYKLATLASAILSSGDMKFTRTGNQASTIAKMIRGKGKDLFRIFSKEIKNKKESMDILRALNDEDILEDIITQINNK